MASDSGILGLRCWTGMVWFLGVGGFWFAYGGCAVWVCCLGCFAGFGGLVWVFMLRLAGFLFWQFGLGSVWFAWILFGFGL